MSTPGQLWATLRENVKKEAECIETEQASAIAALHRSWSESVRAERNSMQITIRELDERLKDDLEKMSAVAVTRLKDATKAALNEIASQHSFVMLLWGKAAGILLVWLAVLGLLVMATLLLGARARQKWNEYHLARTSIEKVEASRTTYESNGALYVEAERVNGVFRGSKSGRWYVPAELSRDGKKLFVRVARR